MNIPPMTSRDLEKTSSMLEIRDEDRPVAEPRQEAISSAAGGCRPKTSVVVIDEKTLFRSCLMRCLTAFDANFALAGYRSVEQWHQVAAIEPSAVVLLCATGLEPTKAAVRLDVDHVIRVAPEARIIVVSDIEEPVEIVEALQRGAKGYISINTSLDVAVAAIRLVSAGGTLVPAGSLQGLSSAATPASDQMVRGEQRQGLFTERQLEVIRRLRRGEANKLIAYNLNLGESTVKVHVRNIMHKIQARNRTEIAFLTNGLFKAHERIRSVDMEFAR